MHTNVSNNLSDSAGDKTAMPNQALVRKGQRKPYIKATQKQIERRIGAAAMLSHCGCSKSEIHRIFREKYGVEWRQTDRYMARAHE